MKKRIVSFILALGMVICNMNYGAVVIAEDGVSEETIQEASDESLPDSSVVVPPTGDNEDPSDVPSTADNEEPSDDTITEPVTSAPEVEDASNETEPESEQPEFPADDETQENDKTDTDDEVKDSQNNVTVSDETTTSKVIEVKAVLKDDISIYYGQEIPNFNEKDEKKLPIYYELKEIQDNGSEKNINIFDIFLNDSDDLNNFNIYLYNINSKGEEEKFCNYDNAGEYKLNIRYFDEENTEKDECIVESNDGKTYKFVNSDDNTFKVKAYTPNTDNPELKAKSDKEIEGKTIELKAPEGFLIGDSNDLTAISNETLEKFKGTLEKTVEEGEGEIVYYLRNNDERSPDYNAISDKMIYKYTSIQTLPEIEEKAELRKLDNGSEVLLNFFTFGAFSDKTVKVTVTAKGNVKDENVSITLFDNETNGTEIKAEKIASTNEDGKIIYKAEFKIKIEEEAVKSFPLFAEITSSTDTIENKKPKRKELKFSNKENTIDKNILVLDNKKSNITYSYFVKDESDKSETAVEGRIYNEEDINGILQIEVKDEGGISQVQVEDKKSISQVWVNDKETELIKNKIVKYPLSVYKEQNGEKTISVKVKDNAGNETDSEYKFSVDTQKPTIELAIKDAEPKKDEKGNICFNNEDINNGILQIEVKDEGGISQVLVKDESSISQDWVNDNDTEIIANKIVEYPLSVYKEQNGEKTISVKVKDNAGNDTDFEYKFRVDTVVPEGKIQVTNPVSEIGDKIWFKDNPANIKINTNKKNVKSIDVNINGITKTYTNDEIKICNDKNDDNYEKNYITFDVDNYDDEHKCVISAVITDEYENKSDELEKLTIYKDCYTPEIESVMVKEAEGLEKIINILTFGIFSKDNIRFAVKASDNAHGSGISKVQIKYNGMTDYADMNFDSNDETYSYYSFEIDKQLDDVISGNVKFKVIDNLDNSDSYTGEISYGEGENSKSTRSKYFMLESILPVVNITYNINDEVLNNDWYGKDIVNNDKNTISITAYDTDSGIGHISITDIFEGKEYELLKESERDYTDKNKSMYTSEKDKFIKSFKLSEFIQGKHIITVTVIDNAGNTNEKYTQEFVIDTINPDGDIKVGKPKYDESWYNEKGTNVKVYVTNEEYPDHVEICVNGENTNYNDFKTDNKGKYIEFTVDKNNLKNNEEISIEATIIDKSGNKSDKLKKTIYIDKEAPTINSVSVSKTGMNNKQVLNVLKTGIYSNGGICFEVEASDDVNGSGVNRVEIKYGNQSYSMTPVGKKYIHSITDYLSSDVEFTVYDNCGHSYTYTESIKDLGGHETSVHHFVIEADNPYVEINMPEVNEESYKDDNQTYWYGIAEKNDEITVSAYDTSGIMSIEITDNDKNLFNEYYFDSDKENWTSEEDKFIKSFRLSEFTQGKHIITVTVIDNAGNSNMKSYTFNVDTENPKGGMETTHSDSESVEIKNNYWYDGENNQEVRLTVTIKDTNIYKIFMNINNKKYTYLINESDIINGEAKIELSTNEFENQDHSYTFNGTLYDMAGNSSDLTEVKFFMDYGTPQITSVKVEKVHGEVSKILNVLTFGIFSNDSIKFTVEASDANYDSGVGKVEIIYDDYDGKKPEPMTKSKTQEGTYYSYEIPYSSDKRKVNCFHR